MLHRERKEGLGPAYLAGFARALDGGAELIVEMDADFSHDPAYLPQLLRAIEDADLVIGSRYVPGGGVTDWGPMRRFISRGRQRLRAARRSGVEVRDLTGGFKCFRREVLEAIDLDSITSQGLRLPGRDDLPGDPGRLPGGRGPDRLPRPPGGQLEDEQGDRRRGDLAGAGDEARQREGAAMLWMPPRRGSLHFV